MRVEKTPSSPILSDFSVSPVKKNLQYFDTITSYTPRLQPALSSDWPYLIVKPPQENNIEALLQNKLLTKLRMPIKGRLVKDSSGTIYLEIPKSVTNQALRCLQSYLKEPAHGAFNTYESEIEELGLEVYFSICGCFSTKLPNNFLAWHLVVDCPGLLEVRAQYMRHSLSQNSVILSSLFGVQPLLDQESLTFSRGCFYVNPSFQPV